MNAPHEDAVEFAKQSKRENRVYVGNLSYDVKYRDLMEFMRGGGWGNLRLAFHVRVQRRDGATLRVLRVRRTVVSFEAVEAFQSFSGSLIYGMASLRGRLLMGAFFWGH